MKQTQAIGEVLEELYPEYMQFLKKKVPLALTTGIEKIDLSYINPALKPHNKLLVKWMVEGGQRACFASFGLHKSVTQLETLRIITEQTNSRGLIICPLGVRQEFQRDAVKILGWSTPPKFIRRIEEAEETGIYLTNYETIRDGKMDPRLFTAASLDEASVLRGFGGSKTFREFMRLFTGDAGPGKDRRRSNGIKYRFVATATPSPNDYIELLAYADFLGVMDISQAKTRFFKRDSTQADKLTLHAHKEEEFWLWVASWALFVTKPSDITGNPADDIGYDLPPMNIRWHEVASDHTNAGTEKSGQFRMFKNSALGIQDSSREKRESLDTRIEKMLEIKKANEFTIPPALTLEDKIIDRAFEFVENYSVLKKLKAGESWNDAIGFAGSSQPIYWQTNSKGIEHRSADGWQYIPLKQIMARAELWKRNHVIIWHDLEREREAIEAALPNLVSIYGSQDLDEREKAVLDFSDGLIEEFAAKPVIAGSGCNFQRHCHWAIYLGIGFKFNDFIQSLHRIQRFLQQHPVEIDLIYTEAEREIRKTLERKWQNHNLMVQKMTEIIKQFGLSHAAMASLLTRKIGIERVEVKGKNWTAINNDNVVESKRIASNSIGLHLTSIPFSMQYEYSPNYADFGHNESNDAFFDQMDYLTPECYRTLMPGRIMAVHVKDRIVPGGLNNLGFQTVYPLHLDTISHFTKHGFAYIGMKTIVTDVVRENKQTYRLGWTEQCKDGSKMGVGMPEYLLLFRKPPTDNSNAYADEPVVKNKPLQLHEDGQALKFDINRTLPLKPGSGYSRSKWQVDAHGFARSNGNRLMKPEEFQQLDHDVIFQTFKRYTLENIYDFDYHVAIGEALEAVGKMPSGFMLLQPQSWTDEVWTDITRMLTLNGMQHAKGKEMHLCPMQFDIADRVIEQMSNPGDIVADFFAGLFTVPLLAMKKGRVGLGIELNPGYFLDGIAYLRAEEEKMSMPTLFDFI